MQDYSSDEFRMFCLLNHYRSRVQWDDEGLAEAKKQFKALKEVVERREDKG